jgi:hypothetical protein
MDEMTRVLFFTLLVAAVSMLALRPVARRLKAKRHGWVAVLTAVLLLFVFAALLAQLELSKAWTWSATLLCGVIAFAIVLGLPLLRALLALLPVIAIALVAITLAHFLA